ncbi:hypothetical protein GCM10018790_52180 [Kitasatospora xanthocidica]|uniref:DUF7919 family protein n=1 Tax=Kitasatospora xanthocidica TaxID=83382 RepID=UPI0016757660|nr:hypothetical protein [Kitasatospora xanthocidica]GHF67768.1 hypothetical protein GCM10018790_52180 [Kitasatospora xanthocidica]
MFYEDLTEYAYRPEDGFTDPESGVFALWYAPAYTRLNVGWLQAGEPYPTGEVPAGFVAKLAAVQQVQWMNVCLGVHECDLCPPGEGPEGNGEIRIPGAPSIAYAAPFLIGHYVTAHGYRPPAAFVDAVLAVDVDAWAAARWPQVPFPWVPEEGVEWLLE